MEGKLQNVKGKQKNLLKKQTRDKDKLKQQKQQTFYQSKIPKDRNILKVLRELVYTQVNYYSEVKAK